ncbi:hypothetical protein AVEN_175378-1 [Araneus ventricosus]|uniref:Uncharacterized protein n=1 Tax=Araneus ventricosus TaxID=182803 RepID=A0A4Y2VQR7_ARAVE|nr:hypothetical protein AVEN_175378-1 [Araneus ventricosus]
MAGKEISSFIDARENHEYLTSVICEQFYECFFVFNFIYEDTVGNVSQKSFVRFVKMVGKEISSFIDARENHEYLTSVICEQFCECCFVFSFIYEDTVGNVFQKSFVRFVKMVGKEISSFIDARENHEYLTSVICEQFYECFIVFNFIYEDTVGNVSEVVCPIR